MNSHELSAPNRVGFVVIGRNEGNRLHSALASVDQAIGLLVYVDSGSSDGSCSAARSSGANVVELDHRRPFSAARGRNAGVAELLRLAPGTRYIQFLDGDCALTPSWTEIAAKHLDSRPDLCATFGRLRELNPAASIFNALANIEWNVPTGLADSFSGVAMVRVTALQETTGYDETVIAGEEVELCMRMRQRGWFIECIAEDMSTHDAAIDHVDQWFTRAKRSGYGMAQVAEKTRHASNFAYRREIGRSLGWTAVLVATAIFAIRHPRRLTLGVGPIAGQWMRIYFRIRSGDHSRPIARAYATSMIAGHVPQAIGIVQYHLDQRRHRVPKIIEYK